MATRAVPLHHSTWHRAQISRTWKRATPSLSSSDLSLPPAIDRDEDVVFRITSERAGIGLKAEAVGANKTTVILMNKLLHNKKLYKRKTLKGTFVPGCHYQLVRVGRDDVSTSPLAKVCDIIKMQETPFEMGFVELKNLSSKVDKWSEIEQPSPTARKNRNIASARKINTSDKVAPVERVPSPPSSQENLQ